MINLYETADGVMVHPQSLTVPEALELHRRGVLCASDVGHLSRAARLALDGEIKRTVAAVKHRWTTSVTWGVRRPTVAYVGRA